MTEDRLDRPSEDRDVGPTDLVADRFYRGTIIGRNPGTLSGVLRTGNGREIAFRMDQLRLLGSVRGFEALREGMRVGFDLGRTSRGLRVTMIRVGDDDAPGR
jgi:cold shock CspA family protein